MKGKLTYKQRRAINTFLTSGYGTRRFYIDVLFELPLTYIHEFGHYIVAFLFGMNPKLSVDYILKVYWSHKHKQHVSRAYAMSVSYINWFSGLSSHLASALIAIAPLNLIFVIVFILFFINIWVGWLFIVYMFWCRVPWNLSKQDTNSLSISLMAIKYMTLKRVNMIYSKLKINIIC